MFLLLASHHLPPPPKHTHTSFTPLSVPCNPPIHTNTRPTFIWGGGRSRDIFPHASPHNHPTPIHNSTCTTPTPIHTNTCLTFGVSGRRAILSHASPHTYPTSRVGRVGICSRAMEDTAVRVHALLASRETS